MQKVTEDLLQKLLTRNVDLNGRRVINAGNAQGLQDYVTLKDSKNLKIETIRAADGTLVITINDADVIVEVGLEVPDDAYGSGWNGSVEVPTKNAIYDKFNPLVPVEGTFSPTLLIGGGAAVGLTYAIQTGTYQKIGNWVTLNGFLQLSAKGSSIGSLSISSLPFTSENVANHFIPVIIWVNGTAAVGGNHIQANMNPNDSQVFIQEIISNVATTFDDTYLSNTTSFMFSCHYKVL